jgi:hypothetical protein
MSLLIALGLAGALLQAGAAPSSASVSGRVVEESSGRPLAGVRVTAIPARPVPAPSRFDDEPRTVMTDQDGRYRFNGLDPGPYRLTAEKVGFAPVDR